MTLKEQIKNYYFDHLDTLPADKCFHFASRLAAWQREPRAIQALKGLESHMIGSGAEPTLNKILAQPIGNLYAKQLRQPYFERYPGLFGIHNALFRIRHLKEIYCIDWRDGFLGIVSRSDLERLYAGLAGDQEALRTLSRFAIDYLFLYEILFERPERIEPQAVLQQAGSYDTADSTQLHLLIYLFTHTIIADTNFYARPVPADRLELYKQMLGTIEPLLRKYGGLIKLDAKFEFLVACRLCRRSSDLFEVYDEEAARSLSPYGSYIFDRLAGGPDAGLNGLERSEHRNVLFIMSGSDYPESG